MNFRELLESVRRPCGARLSARDPVVVHIDSLLHKLLSLGHTIMASNEKQLADIAEVQAQVGKISAETSASLAKIAELEAAVAALPGGSSAEVDAAMAQLKASVQAADDLVADAAAPPTDEAPAAA